MMRRGCGSGGIDGLSEVNVGRRGDDSPGRCRREVKVMEVSLLSSKVAVDHGRRCLS